MECYTTRDDKKFMQKLIGEAQKSVRNEYEWIIPKELPNERIIYNDQKLRFYKAKEVKLLKKTLKEKKSLHTKKMKEIGKKIRLFRKRDVT